MLYSTESRQRWPQGSRTTSAILPSPSPRLPLRLFFCGCSRDALQLGARHLPHSCRAPTHDVSVPLLAAISRQRYTRTVPCLTPCEASKIRLRRGSSELASMDPARFAGAVSDVVERFPRRDVRPRGHINSYATAHQPPRVMLSHPYVLLLCLLLLPLVFTACSTAAATALGSCCPGPPGLCYDGTHTSARAIWPPDDRTCLAEQLDRPPFPKRPRSLQADLTLNERRTARAIKRSSRRDSKCEDASASWLGERSGKGNGWIIAG